MNNAGQIAFFAQLADGRGVIMVATPIMCQGDVNDSGTVDVNDLLAVITAWGPCVNCPAVACVPDIAPVVGGDCMIDVNDLLAVITHWGACP